MNKFTKISAFIVLTALNSSTALPMNRLARVAQKIKPALAAPHRRLCGSMVNPSSRKQDDKQQRSFARPYHWLPALGAAAVLGFNLQREKAECLTVGYGIFFLNPYTMLVSLL